ncbi:hypothetical protein [Lactobacillus gallinarum]|uniref:hypothetical protein n=1 Tax=Lactobacillus gallinarum TaxID=52242 RepID=UPI0024B11683|nr:hypothetical protein [Lactobacillus gallinarum]
MLKSKQNSSITKNINSANCLEINYYDPYGNKVDAYYFAPANAAIFISNKRLKEIIDSNIPENHQIVPYFAYPQHDITSDNTTEEIMIAVKEINPIN